MTTSPGVKVEEELSLLVHTFKLVTRMSIVFSGRFWERRDELAFSEDQYAKIKFER